MAPDSEALDNGEELFVVDVVIGFGRHEFAREKGTRAENTIVRNLGKNTTTRKVQGITFYNRRAFKIVMHKYRCRGKAAF